MRYLIALAILAAGQAFAQQTDSHEVANTQATINGPLQTQLLQQQIEQQRLQNELLKQQIEAQRRAMAAQSARQDHQMRVERVRQSADWTAGCIKSEHTSEECAKANPYQAAVMDDLHTGKISNAEFLDGVSASELMKLPLPARSKASSK